MSWPFLMAVSGCGGGVGEVNFNVCIAYWFPYSHRSCLMLVYYTLIGTTLTIVMIIILNLEVSFEAMIQQCLLPNIFKILKSELFK